MRALITGGAGFIGSHIADALLAAGHEVFVLDNLSSGSRTNLPAAVQVFEVDIRDEFAVATVFKDLRPDWVSHQAAQMSVSRSVREPIFDAEVNVVGLVNVFEHAARNGASRIVFASSGGVLYGETTVPAPESTPAAPISPYGISKWVGEKYLEFYARERGMKGVALRYANVYGPRQNPHGEAGVVAIFNQKTLRGETPTINGDGKYIRDYVYGPDVARANLLAFTVPMESHFLATNIGTGIPTDVNELATRIREQLAAVLTAHRQPVNFPPLQYGPPRAGDLRSNLVAPGYAAEVLGWTPQYTLDRGLQATAEWFYEHTPRE